MHRRAAHLAAHALILGLLTALSPACGKKPSVEYAQASELHRRLRDLHGEEAYREPQMDDVLALLARVPPSSSDKPAADALTAQVHSERARVREQEAAREQAIAQALAVPSYERMGEAAFPERPAAADAGVEAGPASANPAPRMPLKELEQRFSSCFRRADSVNVAGRGQRDTWELKDIANCRDRHSGFDTKLVVIENAQVLAIVDKSAVRLQVPDAGR